MTRTPPRPAGLPVVGHSVAFARDAFGFTDAAVDEHGPVFELDVLGEGEQYVVTDPDLFERVLVTDRDAYVKGGEFEKAFGAATIAVGGETWRDQRDVQEPFFAWDAVYDRVPTIRRQIRARLDAWDDGREFDLTAAMKDLTLDVIFAAVLGHELDVDGDDELRDAADGLNRLFSPETWVLPSWVPTPNRRRFRRSVETLHREIDRLVAGPTVDEGLLAAVADARDDPDAAPSDDDELRDVVTGIVFGGHDTTALALTYTFYLLTQHPEVRARVRDELDAELGDGPLTAESLRSLPYLDAVLDESMRLYPPVHTIPRETARPVTLGDYRLPEGAGVLLNVRGVHRDETRYDEADAFRPSRWVDGGSDRHPYAHLPFGAGPRSCLGRALATVEAKAAVAAVLRRYELEWRGPPLSVYPEMTTQPKSETSVAVGER